MIKTTWIKFLIACLLSILSVGMFSCGDNETKALKLINEGRNKLAFSDINGAKQDFDKAIKLKPHLPEAWFQRGNVWYNMGKIDSAFSDYSKAIELKIDYAEAYSNRARLFSMIGDTDAACSDWLKAESLGMKNLRENTKWCR